MDKNFSPARAKLVPPDVKARKLVVFGIADTSDVEFKNYFDQFGEIEDHVVITDGSSGTPRGFGFVVFKEVAAAD